jgi:hypothetical protein
MQVLRKISDESSSALTPATQAPMLALCLASTAFYGPPAAFQQQRMASPLAREKPVQLATSIKGTPIWE